jgi:hypothetical protein
MHNVLVADTLNVTLPLTNPTATLPVMPVVETAGAPVYMYSNGGKDEYILLDQLRARPVGGVPANLSDPTKADSWVSHYPDGVKKMVALNESAISAAPSCCNQTTIAMS